MQSTSIAELAANIAGEPWGKGSLAHLSRGPCRRIYLWPAMDADRLYRRQSFDIFNFITGTLCVLNCLPLGSVRAILEDGRDKAVEAGCVIAGGHTIQDDEPRYCLCVTGFVHPRHILKNVGTRWTRLDLAADPQTSSRLRVSLPREDAEGLLEKLSSFAP